jgi:hypothetical protein
VKLLGSDNLKEPKRHTRDAKQSVQIVKNPIPTMGPEIRDWVPLSPAIAILEMGGVHSFTAHVTASFALLGRALITGRSQLFIGHSHRLSKK